MYVLILFFISIYSMLYMYFLSYRNYLTVIGVRKRLSFKQLNNSSMGPRGSVLFRNCQLMLVDREINQL